MFVRSLIAGLAFAGWMTTAQATPLNAGFEGGLTGWSSTGEATAATGFGATSPFDGAYMGLISTGGDAVGGTTSSLSQTFTALTIPFTFYVNFLTDESTPSSFYNDTFEVTAVVGGEAVTLLRLDTASVFTGFEGAFEFTGFLTVVLPVATTMVTFTVFDVGDSIINSLALIDAASPVAQVSEPGNFLLIGLGLIGLAGNRRRSRGRPRRLEFRGV